MAININKSTKQTRTTIKLPTWLYKVYKKKAVENEQTFQETIAQNLSLALEIKANLINISNNVSLDNKINTNMPKVKYPQTYQALKQICKKAKQKGKKIDDMDLSRENLYKQILKDRDLI